jgi:hypothetical protein
MIIYLDAAAMLGAHRDIFAQKGTCQNRPVFEPMNVNRLLFGYKEVKSSRYFSWSSEKQFLPTQPNAGGIVARFNTNNRIGSRRAFAKHNYLHRLTLNLQLIGINNPIKTSCKQRLLVKGGISQNWIEALKLSF